MAMMIPNGDPAFDPILKIRRFQEAAEAEPSEFDRQLAEAMRHLIAWTVNNAAKIDRVLVDLSDIDGRVYFTAVQTEWRLDDDLLMDSALLESALAQDPRFPLLRVDVSVLPLGALTSLGDEEGVVEVLVNGGRNLGR